MPIPKAILSLIEKVEEDGGSASGMLFELGLDPGGVTVTDVCIVGEAFKLDITVVVAAELNKDDVCIVGEALLAITVVVAAELDTDVETPFPSGHSNFMEYMYGTSGSSGLIVSGLSRQFKLSNILLGGLRSSFDCKHLNVQSSSHPYSLENA